jgi:hypothetical protein
MYPCGSDVDSSVLKRICHTVQMNDSRAGDTTYGKTQGPVIKLATSYLQKNCAGLTIYEW